MRCHEISGDEISGDGLTYNVTTITVFFSCHEISDDEIYDDEISDDEISDDEIYGRVYLGSLMDSTTACRARGRKYGRTEIKNNVLLCNACIKGRGGSGFYESFCIFANKIIMNCLHIHLVTLFNLLCIHIFVME